MSRQTDLYMSSRIERLAEKLTANLRTQQDPLCAPVIMVPNANLQTWLWKYAAENNQENKTVFNLEFLFLENGVWTLLQGNSERQQNRFKQLDPLEFHLLLLFVLLEEVVYDENNEPCAPDLAPFYPYLYDEHCDPRPGFMKRAWGLSAKLYGYLREYLYQRNGDGQYIPLWQAGSLVDGNDEMERAQCALFRRLFCGEDARLQRLNSGLPEGEQRWLLSDFIKEKAPGLMQKLNQKPLQIHLFGFSHISPFHVEVFRRAGALADFHIYHLNCFKSGDPEQFRTDHALLNQWEFAGRDMLRLLQPLDPQVSALDAHFPEEGTVLYQLQRSLAERELPPQKITQDSSLQLLACPGERREIETVYESICAELERDKDLKLHEIGVLVADMDSYRSHIEAVFERERDPQRETEPRIPYSLSDASRGSSSVYGQAVLQLLGLAQGRFNRQDLFALLRNRVFQAGNGFSRSEVDIWLEWAERLGIFHNREEAPEQRFPLYSWELAVARLQLGQVMAPLQPDVSGIVPDYQGLFPYSDINSDDSDLLYRFSATVIRLIGRLQRLQQRTASLDTWKEVLQQLFDDFLSIPAELARERSIPGRLFSQLETMGRLGGLCNREFGLTDMTGLLTTQLGEIRLLRGRYLHSGVVIAGLHPLRPVPFKIVYLVGMGEGRFPGREDRSTLDLRSDKPRLTGDITNAQGQYYLFLETLLSVRKKLVISYPAEELQKERPLYPSSAVQMLRFWMDDSLLEKPFEEIRVPLTAYSDRYAEPQPEFCDTLVQGYQPAREVYRKAVSGERLEVNKPQRRLDPARIIKEKKSELIPLSLAGLRRFIRNPVEGLLRTAWGVEALKLEDAAGVRNEPWITDRMEKINAVDDALSVMLDMWFSGNRNPSELLDKGREWLAGIYQQRLQQSLKPDNIQGELDLSAWKEALRCRWERLYPHLPQSSCRYWPGVVLLDSLPPGSRMHRAGAVTTEVNGVPFRITGRQGWCWTAASEEAEQPGGIVYLNISRRSKSDLIPDTIQAKLFYLFSFIHEDLPGYQFGHGRVINCSEEDCKTEQIPVIDRERALRIINRMLQSYLGGWLDDLPLDKLKKALDGFRSEAEFAPILNNEPVTDRDFVERVREAVLEELEEGGSGEEPVKLLGGEDELQGLQGILGWIGYFLFSNGEREKKRNGEENGGCA